MISKLELDKQTLAIIVVNIDTEDKDEVVVYTGEINIKGNKLFFNRYGKDIFEITQWQDRIKSVGEEIKEVLSGCEYLITLTIGDLPENDKPETYMPTGLKWPGNKSDEDRS